MGSTSGGGQEGKAGAGERPDESTAACSAPPTLSSGVCPSSQGFQSRVCVPRTCHRDYQVSEVLIMVSLTCRKKLSCAYIELTWDEMGTVSPSDGHAVENFEQCPEGKGGSPVHPRALAPLQRAVVVASAVSLDKIYRLCWPVGTENPCKRDSWLSKMSAYKTKQTHKKLKA